MKKAGKRDSQRVRSFSILHTEASLGWGGQEIRVFTETLGLIKRGHRVALIAQPESKILGYCRSASIPVYPVVMTRSRLFSAGMETMRIIKSVKTQFLNTHSSRDSWLASLAARLSPMKPFILRTRHLSTPIRKNLTSSLIYDQLPHKVITTGEAIRKTMIKQNGYKAEKIISIPTGIDLTLYHPGRYDKGLKAKLGIPEKNQVVGIIAVLRNWKGHQYFVEAAQIVLKQLPETSFIIAGAGNPQGARRISGQIKDLGLEDRVLTLGFREDIPELLSLLDVFVLSSYGHEGIPQAVLQAMAMEKPVVATDVGSVYEAVQDGITGNLVPARDSSALAQKILVLLKDGERREKMGRAGRLFVEQRFSLDIMLDRLEQLYEELDNSRV